jgi:hypothetical protein
MTDVPVRLIGRTWADLASSPRKAFAGSQFSIHCGVAAPLATGRY